MKPRSKKPRASTLVKRERLRRELLKLLADPGVVFRTRTDMAAALNLSESAFYEAIGPDELTRLTQEAKPLRRRAVETYREQLIGLWIERGIELTNAEAAQVVGLSLDALVGRRDSMFTFSDLRTMRHEAHRIRRTSPDKIAAVDEALYQLATVGGKDGPSVFAMQLYLKRNDPSDPPAKSPSPHHDSAEANQPAGPSPELAELLRRVGEVKRA